MTSPAWVDLEERLRTMSEVLEGLVVDDAPDGRAGWASPLLDGIELLGRAARQDEDGERRVELVDAALTVIGRARGASALDADVSSSLDELLAFGKEVRARAVDVAAFLVEPIARDAPPPYRVSSGEPTVHEGIVLPAPDVLPQERRFDPGLEVASALGRHPLGVETVRRWLASDDDDDDDDDARVGEVDPSKFAPPRGTPLEIAQLRRMARDCLEDIASLGGLRRSELELPWDFAEHFERRLLDNLDALVILDRPRLPEGPSLGVARELWAYLREGTPPDPGRAFAFAFVLACSAREAGPRWVGVTLRRAHERLARSLEDALALGRSPGIPSVLAALLASDGEPWRLRVALSAWRRRGGVDAATVLPFVAHPDPSVSRAAMGCLALAPSELAAAALHELLGGDPTTAAEAAVALARCGDKRGPAHLRALLEGGRAGGAQGAAKAVAARAIALLGEARDVDDLARCCVDQPPLLELLGWHGHRAHVPTLLAGLGASEEEGRIAAAWGLTRMFGDPGESGGRAGGPVLDLATWQRIAAAADPAPGKRVQLGQGAASGPGSPRRLAAELRAATTRQRDRSNLLLELELRLGRPVALDLEGWVHVQRTILEALED